jgi:hypothetical protein
MRKDNPRLEPGSPNSVFLPVGAGLKFLITDWAYLLLGGWKDVCEKILTCKKKYSNRISNILSLSTKLAPSSSIPFGTMGTEEHH